MHMLILRMHTVFILNLYQIIIYYPLLLILFFHYIFVLLTIYNKDHILSPVHHLLKM